MGSLWVAVGRYGSLWDLYGSLWVAVGLYGISMCLYGISMSLYESLWVFMGLL